MQMLYLQNLKEMEMYSRQLRPVIYDYYKKAKNQYDCGDYEECIAIVNEFLNTYTVYKVQGGIASSLYTIMGKALYNIDKVDSAYFYLKIANSDGDREANEFLNTIYWKFESIARVRFEEQDYMGCLNNINKAFETGLENADTYILQGDAYKFSHNYNDAKKSYKIANKRGSVSAKDKIKELKLFIKQNKTH